MKKLLYCAAALAMLFFAGSCQKETLEPAAEGTKVTYTVTLPEALQTKGEDGYDQYDLYYQVFKTIDAGELATADELFHGKVLMDSNPKTVVLDLLNDQDYTILFWANKAGMDYFDISNLRNVGVKQAASNNDDRDAFCGFDQIDDFDAAMTKKVTLKRPFAQLNIATIVPELQYSVKPNASYVKVDKVPVAYNVFTGKPVGTETEVEFTKNLIPGGTMTINGTPYTKVAMNYVLVPEANVSVYYEIETDNGTVKNTVPNVPLKPNHRTNIIGNLLTSSASYIIEVLPGFDEPDMHVTVNEVTSSVDLETALRQTDEHIVINLGNNVETKAAVEPMEYTVNVSSWKSMAFGGENTQTITINANGSKINFVQNDSDWSHVTLLNDDAKFIINDAVLTNSKYNTGDWRRNLIHFANEMELNNVKSEKGLGFADNAVLKGLEINVADENYAIWITAQGQTVDIDGLSITATESGRAIKIADEDYEDDAKKVILNVKNAKFTTAKKAAVLVSSCAGAEINWGEGNDIEAVAADKVNPVWVDEDWADYFDLVTVNGATKMLEGSEVVADGFYKMEDHYIVNSAAGLFAFAEAVNNGNSDVLTATVKLDADIDLNKKNWTPIGLNADSNNKFKGTFDGQDHTISNLYVSTPDAYTAAGLFGALNGTAKNFTLDGVYVSHISTGDPTDNGVAAVAGSIYRKGAIDNVTVRNANVYGNRYLGIIAGYTYGSVTNCTVETVILKATPDKNSGKYNNGDKVGAIAGYFQSEGVYEISGNTVTDFEIQGYRDCGAIVGAGNADAVKNNTASNGTVTADQTNGWYEDKDFNLDYIVGRKMSGSVDATNTYSDVELKSVAYVMDDINKGLESGDYTFTGDVMGTPAASNSYGATGINQLNGGTIDGNGNTLEVSANGTWDSAINTTGGTIKNLTIARGFRGIFINHNSDNCSKVYIDNVIIDGPTYTVSCDQGTNNGLEATNSTFKGWTSYASTLGDAKFTDCYFGEGAGYAYFRPYAPTTFVNCEFEAGFQMDPRAAVSFENCTLGGVLITEENYTDLVISNSSNVSSINGNLLLPEGLELTDEGVYVAETADALNWLEANQPSVFLNGNVQWGTAVYSYSNNGTEVTMTAVGENAKTVRGFVESSVTNVTVSEGIKVIGDRTFRDATNLASVSLPNSLTELEEGAFQSCGLTAITIPGENVILGKQSIGYLPKIETITITAKNVTFGQYVSRSCANLKEVYIYSDEIEFGQGSMYFTNKENGDASAITFYVKNQEIADEFYTGMSTSHSYGLKIVSLDGNTTFYNTLK